MSLDDTLTQLGKILYGRNYAVRLRVYESECRSGTGTIQILQSTIGPDVVLGNSIPIEKCEVLEEIENAIRYRGDESSGPGDKVLRSSEFSSLLDQVLSTISEYCDNAHGIESFWLKEGHPDYPVFWEFSFLFRFPSQVIVLIGSSTD